MEFNILTSVDLKQQAISYVQLCNVHYYFQILNYKRGNTSVAILVLNKNVSVTDMLICIQSYI